jgi:drug/metabolite transporter (DMT)-like permease
LNIVPPFLFAGIRFFLAGLLLLSFCGGIKSYFKAILLLSFFQTFLLYSLLFWGMSFVSGSIGAIVTGSSPLIAAIAAHIFIKRREAFFKKSNLYFFRDIRYGFIC